MLSSRFGCKRLHIIVFDYLEYVIIALPCIVEQVVEILKTYFCKYLQVISADTCELFLHELEESVMI